MPPLRARVGNKDGAPDQVRKPQMQEPILGQAEEEREMTGTYHQIVTKNGYDFSEVASALQKSIRRGIEEDALYWAVELDISGYGEYCWKRMRIMVSEDIGLAEPMMPANIQALYDTWLGLRKKNDEAHCPERLMLIHAVLLLVRARKSRLIDDCLNVVYNHAGGKPIPDWAYDKHTGQGRRMKRGWAHFYEVGCRLENHEPQAGEGEYHEAVLRLRSSEQAALV